MIERRRYRRDRLSNDSIQVYRHSDKKIGWIRDVCRGGFSYEYISTHAHIIKDDTIDVFSDKNDGGFIPRVLCKTVYDVAEYEKLGSAGPVQFNRRGLKCEFTVSQKKRIQNLLKMANNES